MEETNYIQLDLTNKYIELDASCLEGLGYECVGSFAYNLKTYVKGNYRVFTDFNEETEREEIYRVFLEVVRDE